MTCLTVSVPISWAPVLFAADDGCLPRNERIAYRRWRTDMVREFGEFTTMEIDRSRTYDPVHEGTEYGSAPAICNNVVLAFED